MDFICACRPSLGCIGARAESHLQRSTTVNNLNAETKPKVLACIDQSDAGELVCRRAKVIACQSGSPWTALHVANPANDRGGRAAKERLLQTFRLAQELGAETLTLSGEDIASEILRHAAAEGVTQIVIGAPSAPWPLEVFGVSPVRRLMRDAGGIGLEVCARQRLPLPTAAKHALGMAPWGNIGAYLMASAFIALATLIALPIQRATGLPNVSLIYVLAVIAASIRYGGVVSMFTAIASALAYNFFMTQPYYSFTIYDPINVWAVLFFLVIGITVSALAAHARAQTALARKQAREATELRLLTQALVNMGDRSEIARLAANAASRLLRARGVVLFEQDGLLEMAAEAPSSEVLGSDDAAAARWVFQHGREAGRGSDTLDAARWLFTPARGEHGVVAALGVRPFEEVSSLDPDQRRLLDLIANQIGLALDRSDFARDAMEARIEMERARAKTRLMAAASTHQDGAAALMVRDVVDEGVTLHEEPVAVVDLVEAAIERARGRLHGRFISRDLKSDLPIIFIDRALTEDAFACVLLEVARNAAEKSTILVRATRQDRHVQIEVCAEEEIEAAASAGPSLALLVARAFLEAEAVTLDSPGARMRMLFPTAIASAPRGANGITSRVC